MKHPAYRPLEHQLWLRNAILLQFQLYTNLVFEF